ncbi:MAG: DUF4102 domain-containing protein [Shimia sp.]|uniref:tyrosine-type recombinase/integrase n=1 Tax=Shimia sp. TaxID=1954381 RepID=UPI003B8C88AD
MPVLSDARIRALKPREKPIKQADFDGFYLLIKPNGSKLWRFKYRWLRKEKLLALGKYPEVILADAWRKRDEARSLIANDEDPSSVRKAQKAKAAAEQTEAFAKIAAELLEKKRIEGRAETTLAKTEWFHRLLGADIGQMPISQITARDVLVPLKRIENKGNHESAIRMRPAAGAVFRYHASPEAHRPAEEGNATRRHRNAGQERQELSQFLLPSHGSLPAGPR